MDFLSNLAKRGDSKNSAEEKSSTTDLFSNAKVVADAAQAQFGNEPQKYDKGKAAGAGADLLDAASDYGKLDETQGFGKYVGQTEGYLRQYNTSQTTPAAAAETGAGQIPSEGGAGEYKDKAEAFLSKPSEGGGEDSGVGGYVKKAEEVYSEPTDGGEEAGGVGGYAKKAEEFVSEPSEGGAGAEELSSKPHKSGVEAAGAADYIKEEAEEFSSNPPQGSFETSGAADYVKDAVEDFPSKPSQGRFETGGAGAEESFSKPSEGNFDFGGAGEYAKKAGEYLSKPSDGGEKGEAEGGYGGLLKAAGGYINK